MKTVQMTLDEQLLRAVDSAARKLGTARSGFTREALRSALKEVRVTVMGTDISRSSGASLAPGNRNRSGVIDEARRGQMVGIFQTGQKTAGAHPNQRFGVGVPGRSHRRTDHNNHSRYSVRSFVDEGRWNAERLRGQF